MDRLSKKIRKKLPKIFQQSVSPGQPEEIVAGSSGFREDQGADPGDVPTNHRDRTPGQLLRQSSVVCLPDETRDAEVAGIESAETSRSMYP